jgi:hypothetical protein
MSTLSLAKNGYVSSSKRTKHIKAKYFFVRHYHNTGEIDLQYCPTEQMWADVLTKPLQGAKILTNACILDELSYRLFRGSGYYSNIKPYVIVDYVFSFTSEA